MVLWGTNINNINDALENTGINSFTSKLEFIRISSYTALSAVLCSFTTSFCFAPARTLLSSLYAVKLPAFSFALCSFCSGIIYESNCVIIFKPQEPEISFVTFYLLKFEFWLCLEYELLEVCRTTLLESYSPQPAACFLQIGFLQN